MVMMKIKLTSIPAYYINLHNHRKKNKSIKKLLAELGFHTVKRTPGFVSETNILGCGLAHQNVLVSLGRQEGPFLLFEDDIAVTHFDHIIDVPDDADAIYLGVSKMGIIDGADCENIIVSKVEGFDNVFRIYNMLAAHAILYLNMDYVRSASKYIQEYIDLGQPHDIGLAEHMGDWKVYAIDKPVFIQSEKFRYFTDTPISKLDGVTYI
jgi:hypothetical protein